MIFQSSLVQAMLPSKWKEVHGVFKKGKREEPKNYRPISLTCIPCKILENIVHCHIMDFFESNNVLAPTQHDFRQKHSETRLLSTIHDISSALNERKAFHLVGFLILQRPLKKYHTKGS